MLHQLEGSQAVARAIALCRPEVVCAYPITPQTHIVEGVGELVRSGQLENCQYLNVESEMAAISVAIGSEAAGVRSYTATSSQGLLYMMEAVYNASGLELPIVMTLGNRAIGAPLNIWNDHTDAMSARDAGWLMMFAENNQEAADLHIQAFKIAETLKCPIMVCMDGFILTHAYEKVDLPEQSEVDEFLPPYEPAFALNPKNPCAIGAMVPTTEFMEVRYLAHLRQLEAKMVIEKVGREFGAKFKRSSGGLIRTYRTEGAETIIVAMGSVLGSIKDTVDDLNHASGCDKYGVMSVVSYRPFPDEQIREALKNAKRVIVVEKAFALGRGGILSREVELALKGLDIEIITVIAGLGGRVITKTMLSEVFQKPKDKLIFLGLREDVIRQEYKTVLDERRA
ncbi:MAG: pyruvate ferredoxin oxidoreductase [Alphaproteobacteria bacterium]|nr:pyruvate ferredoxin oxidoreductase [Alphaproteobacteria bacterium]